MSNQSPSNSSSHAAFPVRSVRLGLSSIAIPEEDDPNKVRIYRLSNRRPSKSTVYYRCSTCESIWAREKKASGDNNEHRYSPTVKTVHGKLVGNAHPEHHPRCKALPKEVQYLQEVDRTCRAKIKAGSFSPEAAQKLGELVTQTNVNLRRNSDCDVLKPSKSLSRKYSAMSRNARRTGSLENEHLLRVGNADCDTNDAGTSSDNNTRFVRRAPCKLGYAPLIVPQPGGKTVRIYHFGNKSADNKKTSYRCSRCDYLCRKHKDEPIRATLKVEDDLVSDMYPAHHVKCAPTPVESLKGLGDNLKNFCVLKNHRIFPLNSVDEIRSDDGYDVNASLSLETPDEQPWETVSSEEMQRRLYEENLELYQDMLNSLNEMRAVVSDLKCSSGMDTGYYVDEGDVLEEADGDEIYVVD